jgi:hypothetical protein
MTPYATYNEYYAATQTVQKMKANPKRAGNDTKELSDMINRIELTDVINEKKKFLSALFPIELTDKANEL